MTRLVVDASVAVKWFLDEPYAHEARQLLTSRVSLLAPELLFSEAANVLWKRVMRGEIALDDALSFHEVLTSAALDIHPTRRLTGDALRLAAELGQSVSDCLYLALALKTGSPLVTADRKLFVAVSASIHRDAIVWLSGSPPMPLN